MRAGEMGRWLVPLMGATGAGALLAIALRHDAWSPVLTASGLALLAGAGLWVLTEFLGSRHELEVRRSRARFDEVNELHHFQLITRSRDLMLALEIEAPTIPDQESYMPPDGARALLRQLRELNWSLALAGRTDEALAQDNSVRELLSRRGLEGWLFYYGVLLGNEQRMDPGDLDVREGGS